MALPVEIATVCIALITLAEMLYTFVTNQTPLDVQLYLLLYGAATYRTAKTHLTRGHVKRSRLVNQFLHFASYTPAIRYMYLHVLGAVRVELMFKVQAKPQLTFLDA
ncbi:hypothetical protein DFP73DRAFT_525450 [Morchella snyderi]|nr:hypothetical protein DFP73DRAFT_525450 [Morchella snyderi]